MAIIYTYPQINSSSDLSVSDLMIISDMSANGRPTKSLTLKNLADFVTSTGTGTGTTNKIIKWSDGPAGLLGDSIMNEDVDKIYVDGQLRIGSSSGASRIQIFHDALDSDNTFSSGGATGSQIIGRRNELYIENRGASRGDIIFKANNGEDNGSVDTYFLLDASMADIGTSAKYTRWPDQSRIVLGNSSNVNSLDFEMYHDGGTGLKNGASNLNITSKGGIFIENESGGSGDIDITQSVTNADVNITAYNGNYFKADTSAGATIFSKPVQVPLVPTVNANAASKQYVDQQIASIPAGLVFQGNWNASTNTPTLASGVGTVGNYYVVSVAGNTNLDGITDWEVGDWAVFVEVGGVDKWDKIDQTFVQGAGAIGQVSFWNGINSVTGDNDLYWDNSNKRLGIGTTSPEAKLDIVSASNQIKLSTGTAGDGYLNIGHFANGTFIGTYGDDSGAADLIRFGTHSGDERMRITSGGDVGIGTSSPATKLDVNGGLNSDHATFSGQAARGLKISTTNITNNDDGVVYNAQTSTGTHVLQTNGTERMRIDSSSTTKITSDGTSTAGTILELHFPNNNSTDICATINLTNNVGGYAAIVGGTTGANNTGYIEFKTDNAGTQGTVLTLGATKMVASKDLHFADNVKAMFGNISGTSDLKIYHDGSNSFIQDSGTGNLILSSSSLTISNAADTEFMARMVQDAQVELYYNGSKKLETTSTGTKTTGQMDLAALNTAVANSDDNGTPGEIRFTANYIYVCIADDQWKRVALSTW